MYCAGRLTFCGGKRNTWKSGSPAIANPSRAGTNDGRKDSSRIGAISMLMIKERTPAIRTLRGWAISVLQEAGAIRECEEHGWMQDRADPHARERAFDERPPGTAGGRLAGRSARRDCRRAGLDRRYLPRVSARIGGQRRMAQARSLSAAETLLEAFARIADLLDGFLHRRRRPPGLLRTRSVLRSPARRPLWPGPACARVPSSSAAAIGCLLLFEWDWSNATRIHRFRNHSNCASLNQLLRGVR